MNKFYHFRLWMMSVVFATMMWQCAGTPKKSASQTETPVVSENVEIDSTITADPSLEAFIAPYREKLDKTMNVVIGYAAEDFKKGKPDAPLNDLVADFMLSQANLISKAPIDAALTNVGGLRVSIPKGPITLEKIYELMPFENELVSLEMTGAQMQELARQIGAVGGECVAGMRMEFLDKRLAKFTIGGKSVDPAKTYYLVTSDYLASPGREKLEILGQVPKTFLGMKLREAILNGIKAFEAEGKQVTPGPDSRIVFRESPGTAK